jgi:hypothetical protein
MRATMAMIVKLLLRVLFNLKFILILPYDVEELMLRQINGDL